MEIFENGAVRAREKDTKWKTGKTKVNTCF